jgi:release factor glutamine methyltransferase
MTIQEALREGNSILLYAEVETPTLDGTILLAESLGITKERLYASLADEIDPGSYDRFRELVDKRCAGYPVSYITKRKEFFGLMYYVDERVLVPRPDTETLVEEVLSLAGARDLPLSLADVCTGSGCIAITLKKNMPALDVVACDISGDALDVFALNSRNILGYALSVEKSDLLESVERTFDYIVSNPPYMLSREVRDMKKIGWPEPALALDGGESGVEITERLIRQSAGKLNRGGRLFIESDPGLMERLSRVMENEGFEGIAIHKDLAGLDRVISGGIA